jgi:cytochrome P450
MTVTRATHPNDYGVLKGPCTPPVYPTGLGDLCDIETFRHGHPAALYAQIHETAPVYWNDEPWAWGEGFWAVTRYDDVAAISKNPLLFSSEVGGHQITYGDPRKADPNLVKAVVGNMIAMDPPQHQVYRRMVTPAFGPKPLAALNESIKARVTSILDAIATKGEAEFVTEVAELLPIYTLADLLGVPDPDRPKMLEWTNKLIAAQDPTSDYRKEIDDPDLLSAAVAMEMFGYGQWLFQKKKAEPANDLTSWVAHATPDDGKPIAQHQLDGFFILMVIAGNETTRNTMSGLLTLLSRNEEQRALLLSDLAGLLPNAVNEALRLVSPVIHFRRTATADTQIQNQPIKAGEKVVMWYGAANRDARVFADPERFDIRRANADKHLAFGIGEHFCLGSRLGLMQIEAMFSALLTRFPDMRMTAEPDYVGSNFISGIRKLPVAFTPRRG